MGNDESILLGFMKDVSDALQEHGNHKCLMQQHAKDGILQQVSLGYPFALISWHIAWLALAYTKHTIYRLGIGMNMRNDIMVDRNEFMSHGRYHTCMSKYMTVSDIHR